MKADFNYIYSDFKVKELYDIRLKNFQRENTVLTQMSLPRANHLIHNTYFLLGLMNRHLVQWTWLNDLAMISLNCISNRMSAPNKAAGWMKRQILSSSEILGEEIFPKLPYLSKPDNSAVPLKLSEFLSSLPLNWWMGIDLSCLPKVNCRKTQLYLKYH